MKRGVVVGEVWGARRVAALEGRKLTLVAELPDGPEAEAKAEAEANDRGARGAPGAPGTPEAPDPHAVLVVAIDTLAARTGQEVLVAFGSGARNVLEPGPHNRHLLCDAAIALLVDPPAPASMPTSRTATGSGGSDQAGAAGARDRDRDRDTRE